jgi:hypothetical protein
MNRLLYPALGALALAACARPTTVENPAPPPQTAPPAAHSGAPAAGTDRRAGLGAGWMNAAEAIWNMRVVSRTPPSSQFMDPSKPGEVEFINSDLAFKDQYVVQGNFHGYQIWDISRPAQPTLVAAVVCPGSQNDVSVYRNLLFTSGESYSGRVDCGTQGVRDSVSKDRMRGIRIFDISDVKRPRNVAHVQTCRGSHTHTVVTDPGDTANVYIYVSGSAPVRSPNELAGCSSRQPDQDPNTALFRIEVIQVPLAAPQQARIVSSPRIFTGLTAPPTHGEAPEDVAAARRVAEAARARGQFTAQVSGTELVLPPQFINPLLDSIVKARQGSGPPTASDSAALRGAIQGIVDRIVAAEGGGDDEGSNAGPTQCHDITAYPEIGLAGGACGEYGLLLDIRDVKNPRRIAAVADSNFAYWHSATFNNDGTTLLFTDEWGGGLQPRCRPSDRREWGANALFARRDGTLQFMSYYKLPAPQTPQENCVAHNGSLVPVPGRDIMVQAWYQGGISVFDFTDPARPYEIAYYDRGPMDATRLQGAGSWSAYWYNGSIISSEIARGLDILELTPSALLSQNEIDAAKLVRMNLFNAQHQQKIVWPAHVAVSLAFLDQLERSRGLSADRIAATRAELNRAQSLSGTARRDALNALAASLERDAAGAGDQQKVRTLAASVSALAGASTP